MTVNRGNRCKKPSALDPPSARKSCMRGKRSGPQPTTDTVLRRLEVAITRLECAAASLNAVVERLAGAAVAAARYHRTVGPL
jgi:hypothetical protein